MKPWYTSKTVWINGLSFIAAVLALLIHEPAFADYSKYSVLALSLVNICLRVITSEKLQ